LLKSQDYATQTKSYSIQSQRYSIPNNTISDSTIPIQYRTRGQRYDDLLVPEKKQSCWDKLETFLWGESKWRNKAAMYLCGVTIGYFIAHLICKGVR